MLEVVAYAAGIAHAGCGDYDLRSFILVYGLGFLLTYRQTEPGEAQRIFARADNGLHLLVNIARVALQKHARCLDGKRAVNVNGKVGMPRYKAAIFDLADKIQHFLRSADSERGDHDIAAAVERALDACGKLGNVIGALIGVVAVTVGGLDH